MAEASTARRWAGVVALLATASMTAATAEPAATAPGLTPAEALGHLSALAEASLDADHLKIAEARAAFAAPAATIDKLRAETADLTAKLEAAQAEITNLQGQVASIEGMKEQYRGAVPIKWVGGAIAVCFVLGFLVALWWTDRQSRKRHGGIRIY